MTPVVQTVAEAPATPRGLLSLRDLLVQVFYNQKAILVCLAIGLTLGVVAAVFSPPKFTAAGLILLRIGATQAAQIVAWVGAA